MSAGMKSASCGSSPGEMTTIRCDRLAWSLMIGGVVVAAVSFLAGDAVGELVSATCEEFWIILVVALQSLCISEWRGAKKKPRAKGSPVSKRVQEVPKEEADAPHTKARGDEAECQQKGTGVHKVPEKEAGAPCTQARGDEAGCQQADPGVALYLQAMHSGDLPLAEAALELLLAGLQAPGRRTSLRHFRSSACSELVRGFLEAGQAQRAGRWFGELVRTARAGRWGVARRQEIGGFQGLFSELVRKSAREGSVEEAKALLSVLHDAAPVVRPGVACFTSVISACAKAGDVAGAEAWLAKAWAPGICPEEANYAALINAYARRGDIETAKGWLHKMRATFTEARTQSYRFDLVFQACGQISAAGEGESCGSGAARSATSLRAGAPEFQPATAAAGRGESCGSWTARSATSLRAGAPEFQPSTAGRGESCGSGAARSATSLRVGAPEFQPVTVSA